MSVYTALHTLASEWRAHREEARTRRIVASLPVEIQKDIGWPGDHPVGKHGRLNPNWTELR